jgi:hypothetical protein
MNLGVAGIGFGCMWPRPTEAAVPWAKILSIVSGIGTVATTTKDVADAIQAVKGLLPQAESAPETPPSGITPLRMQPFHPQIPDTFAGGRQWLLGLQNLAAQFGNPWVPSHTQGFLGINLTGIWVAPRDFSDQTYIRQFGPYLNVIGGIGGVPTLFGEGLFDPKNNVMHILGQMNYIVSALVEIRAQLFSNWIVQGMLTTLGPSGRLGQSPFIMVKIA